jgi:hypothetical protein
VASLSGLVYYLELRSSAYPRVENDCSTWIGSSLNNKY